MNDITEDNITEDNIANYLLATPDFFDRHSELLARVELLHPRNGRAISLVDRQMDVLREKIKLMESKHAKLMSLGKENVQLAGKLHEWMLGLLAYRGQDSSQARAQACAMLQRIFDVPQAAVDGSQAAQLLAASMAQPTCGLAAEAFFQNANVGAALPDAAHANSIAVIPMPGVGLLVLASPDPARFTADMGTEFLTRLGQLAHAALA
jgi:uncharacterized protein